VRAVVITAPGRLEIRDVPAPTAGPEQVLVRVEGCGVCGSNLPRWEGRPWFSYPALPGSPGHEGWGRVEAIGSAVSTLAVGDRVGFLSDGAFAELDVARADAVVRLPPALAGSDVPAEALGCVMNVWRRSAVQRGTTVAVIGVGFLGGLLIQLAARAGARVIAVSRRPWSLELARRLGAVDAISLDDSDDAIEDRVEELTDGAGCAQVFEAVGLQRPLGLAARLCAVRGRLVIVGFHQDGPRHVDMQLWNWRGLDVVNAHERDAQVYVRGMEAAIDAQVSRAIDPAPLLTHRIPLAEAGDAFELLRTRPPGFVKALVIP
jgi:threonine dehydrogenase-like Zn-dependent dehydrogenase